MGLKKPHICTWRPEGHAGNYMLMKVTGDPKVNMALESQLSRKTQWTGKSSTVVKCKNILDRVSENNMLPTSEN